MMDYIELDSVPVNEECTQLGDSNFREQELREIRRYLQQLRQIFVNCGDIYFTIQSNQHDFGDYRTIRLVYDDSNTNSINEMLFVDAHTPENWTDSYVYTKEDIEEYIEQRKNEPKKWWEEELVVVEQTEEEKYEQMDYVSKLDYVLRYAYGV